jgi:two-component system LytT family response regulator
MANFRALIVDDEPLARRSIRLLLERDHDIEIAGECTNGADAVEFVKVERPDLVFLDIQMPGLSGFDVLETLSKCGPLPVIVFVTAFDEHAIRAFEFNALDYLLKPFSDERFERSLERAKSQLTQQEISQLSKKLLALAENYNSSSQAHVENTDNNYTSRFMIKAGGRISFVKAEEIDWIEAADYYVNLHVGRKGHLIRETMNELEKKMDPARFVRIHRSTIVNIDRIKELQPYFNGHYVVILNDGTELKMSRSRRDLLHDRLNK